MKRKTALTWIINSVLLVSIVAGMQVVEVAKANFYLRTSTFFYPPTPNTDPPKITILTPTNATHYLSLIPLAVTITEPNSWNQNNITSVYIMSVSYELDNKSFTLWESSISSSYLPSNSSFIETLGNLTGGQHTLQVNVERYSYYDADQSLGFHSPGCILWNTTGTVLFNVNTETPSTPSLNPTLSPTPSPSPSPSLSPSISPSPSIPEFPSFTVISFLMVAIVLTAILYKGKHSRLKQG